MAKRSRMDLKPLGSTGILVSPLGLGTVKFGRNEQVKYPFPFEIPKNSEISNLLALASELGINILDTAPAYGNSQDRIGSLLPGPREKWVIVSKVGESFADGKSSFDFSKKAIKETVENSLKRLKTDYIDCVLIHSNGDDLKILKNHETLDILQTLKEQGLIRSFGMSTKTLEGGLKAVELTDVVMVTCNLEEKKDLNVLKAADLANKGVLIKKGLMSGHLSKKEELKDSLKFIFSQPGVNSLIFGTVNTNHLKTNVLTAKEILGK